MNRSTTLPILLLALAHTAFTREVVAQIARGNLVVERVGSGTGALTNAATAVFLDEYTPAGTLVQSLALPTAVAGANRRVTSSGTAASEGHLNLSADGRYLVTTGYDADVGTGSVVATTNPPVSRVVARIDLSGNIDSSTAITDAFSANNVRSAASDDGSRFWVAGANSGLRFVAIGGTTTVPINTAAPTNLRTVTIQGAQLFISSASGSFQGVGTLGYGLPTTGGQIPALLSGFPTASGPSPYDHWLADPTTLYVADDRTTVAGGIQKWTLVGGTWVLQYTLNPAAGVGCRGLSGYVSSGVATLFATTTLTTANQIVSVTDTGSASAFTTVATAAANTAFRGLRFIGSGSILRRAHGCGPTTLTAAGQPVIGATLAFTLGGLTGTPYLGLGVNIFDNPFCSCTLGHEWLVALGGSPQLVLTIPNLSSLVGGRVGFQGIDAFGSGGCSTPPLTITDTVVVSVGR